MAALKSKAKPRLIRKGDCVLDFMGYSVLVAAIVVAVTVFDMPGLWPAAVLLALWGVWTPYHAVRNYRKIKATGKPVSVSLPDAWRRYYKGLQWSAFFSSMVALFCTYATYHGLAVQADDLASPALHEVLRTQLPLLAFSFFLTPMLLLLLSLWGRAHYRQARQKEIQAVTIAVPQSVPVTAPSARWWTSTETRDEIQRVERK